MANYCRGFYLFLCFIFFVTAALASNHHGHHKHRHPQYRNHQQESDAASLHALHPRSTDVLTIAAARELVSGALKNIRPANKLKIDNPRLNRYEFRKFEKSNPSPAPVSILELKPDLGKRSDFEAGTDYIIPIELAEAARLVAEADAKASDATIKKRAGSSVFWMEHMEQNGNSPWAPKDYKVWRNVKDYGAKGDGQTDDTAAINKAIADQNRCGAECGSSTVLPAVVYFPSGTYLVSGSIIQYYNTQMIGDPLDRPIIKAAASFVGLGVITSNVYIEGADGAEWYINQNNFLRQIRNFVVDITDTDHYAYVCGIHWQVAQGTTLENIDFIMSSATGTTQQGIFMENGSGGVLNNLKFTGGNFGAYLGNQQFTSRDLIFRGCKTALQIHWDWAWTMKNVDIKDCDVGIYIIGGAGGPGLNSGEGGAGSFLLLDSKVADTPVAVMTSLFAENSTSFLLENIALSNVLVAVQEYQTWGNILEGPGAGKATTVVAWGFGNVYSPESSVSSFQAGPMKLGNKKAPSLLENGAFFVRNRPQYEDVPASNIRNVKTLGAKGDGSTDDSTILNTILQDAALENAVVFFPFGVYVVKDTVVIPPGSRIIGQAWSQIMAKGTKFSDASSPKVVVRVGQEGDVGSAEISDLMFTVTGATAGAVLVEWNIHESKQGSAAMWDSHFRVGGAIGSDLQAADCPKLSGSVNKNCMAAALLLRLTTESSAYMENIWAWIAETMFYINPVLAGLRHPHNVAIIQFSLTSSIADHDLDVFAQTQIDVYVGRGILIESQGPTWLYGTSSEHAVLYQYQFDGAKDLFLAMIQTEAPYFQSTPAAPEPFEGGVFANDPAFKSCDPSSKTCGVSWAVRILNSAGIHLYSAGLYSWFSEYSQDCLITESCQDKGMEIRSSTDIWIFNLVTKAIVEMVSPYGESPTLAADNKNGFLSSIMAWLGGAASISGDGFLLFAEGLENLHEISMECTAALMQPIGCDNYLHSLKQEEWWGSLDDNDLMKKVCAPSCGTALSSYHDDVARACADDVDPWDTYSATYFGDALWDYYNTTCFKDSTTGEWCMDVIDQFQWNTDTAVQIDWLSKEEMCSDCYVKHFQLKQQSRFANYDSTMALYWEDIQKLCTLSSPTEVLEPARSVPIAEEPVERTCFSGNRYTTKAEDTCISIAKANNVASGSLWAINPVLGRDCNRIKAGLDICLPDVCKTHEVKVQDTCRSIEYANGLWAGNLLGFNPVLNKYCSNLKTQGIICVSPPGGDFTPTLIPNMPTVVAGGAFATATVEPPTDAPIASGTTRGCGWYHLASVQDTCTTMCLRGGIDFPLFQMINPSVGKLCEDNLAGTYYCLRPTEDWVDIDARSNSSAQAPVFKRSKQTATRAAAPRMSLAARL